MPRASKYLVEGYIYHLTQRCTNRQPLLRFERDKQAYREWLRRGVKRHGVSVYGHNIMCTHTHLLVQVDDVAAVGAMMDLVAGAAAQQYNRRKSRSGAFFEPYQCTIVQGGRHLLNCLRYIELNMVRAGRVGHPRDWRWCSYGELMGERRRYRLLDIERLLGALEISTVEAFRKLYAGSIDEAIEHDQLRREAFWTESLAVGSEPFVSSATKVFTSRYRFEYRQERSVLSTCPAWTVRELPISYTTV